MLAGDGVHVRQIEDRDRTQARRFVLADLADVKPVEQRSSASRSVRGIHAIGSAVVGRSAEAAADVTAGKRVEQARLADARPADEGQDVRVAREADATGAGVMGGTQLLTVETEEIRGVGCIERRGEAARQRLGCQGGGLPSRAPIRTGESMVAVMRRRP